MRNLAEGIIATVREPLLVLDGELRIQLANQAFYLMFQVEPEEVLSQSLMELGNGQWNNPQLCAALHEIIDRGSTLEDFSITHHFPGIGHKVMLLNAGLIEGDTGAAPLIVLTIDDITRQRQAEATIQAYLKKLEWSNRVLEDFAYIASHDLQEPLRAIQAFSDRLQSKHAQSLDEQGMDYLSRIQNAAGRMRQLISDLLTYSRVTTQGKPFEEVSLSTLAQECIADLMTRLEETGGHIEIGALPSLEADPVQMRQLLQNLFDNGLKFHRADESPVVKVLSHNTGDFSALQSALLLAPGVKYCHFSVQDNGIGFDAKYKDRIFAPFERLHSQKLYPGTGIGLAVCRRIVERHGGSLTVESTPGTGTTFFITLPLKQPDHPPVVEAFIHTQTCH